MWCSTLKQQKTFNVATPMYSGIYCDIWVVSCNFMLDNFIDVHIRFILVLSFVKMHDGRIYGWRISKQSLSIFAYYGKCTVSSHHNAGHCGLSEMSIAIRDNSNKYINKCYVKIHDLLKRQFWQRV